MTWELFLNHTENEAVGLATNNFLLLEKYLHELETISAQHLGFNKMFIISLVSK